MSRSAKVARVIPLETPDNSSSEDEDELEELQVYFKELPYELRLNSHWNVSRSMKIYIFCERSSSRLAPRMRMTFTGSSSWWSSSSSGARLWTCQRWRRPSWTSATSVPSSRPSSPMRTRRMTSQMTTTSTPSPLSSTLLKSKSKHFVTCSKHQPGFFTNVFIK